MNENGQFGEYNIDICLCIDKTGSMTPIIDTVKQNALNLYGDITNSLEAKGKHINRFRIRVICFGDYKADEVPMLLSPFLTLPDDEQKFKDWVNAIQADGGGDFPEDGLEALAYAMRSDWCKDGWKKRHIIALFTDAPAHELGFCKSSPKYPKTGMPENFGELSEMWGDEDDPGEMDYQAKRLLLFAPDTSFWNTISRCWENTVIRTAKEATGLQDITYQVMLDTIVNSVS
ncbi:MAG: VWA domain-containing protein [Lachnospiraceae bacterium]|nr:VWA domain-containing protein [Lachnospiraceae bacterium]